jgi:Fe-S cluster assembly iron-binding protein IscA
MESAVNISFSDLALTKIKDVMATTDLTNPGLRIAFAGFG